jgi:hypothetical protein
MTCTNKHRNATPQQQQQQQSGRHGSSWKIGAANASIKQQRQTQQQVRLCATWFNCGSEARDQQRFNRLTVISDMSSQHCI